MTLTLNALLINSSSQKTTQTTIEAVGPLDAGIRLHYEKETWKYPSLHESNLLVFGKGPLTGLGLFGSHRLTFIFKSPITGGLHASSMGGAAYAFTATGLDLIVLDGRSSDPCILLLENNGEGLEDKWYCLEKRMLDKIYEGYKGYRGTRALHKYIAENILGGKPKSWYRILLVGPAAWTTLAAGVFSWVDDGHGNPSPIVDSASRGGAGTVMAQAHGVAAIIVGGKPRTQDKRFAAIAKKIIEEKLGKPLHQAVSEATTKYRFDPKLGTGGTFGVNYYHYRELLPVLAYNSIYMSRTVRLHVHQLIMEYFWKPFQEQVFESKIKPWRTCGEPCSVACKKIWNNVKLDYEPAHAMGPMIGVITLQDTAKLVELVDDLGIDAIEAGHIVAWLFDAIDKDILDYKELGLPSRPVMDPLSLSPISSRNNAILAERILNNYVERSNEILSLTAMHGARYAAKILDELYDSIVSARGTSFKDLLVYAGYGENGYMTPNYYWSPGMIAPLFVLGRYWTNYSPTYSEPEEYARISIKRAISEMAIDNAGVCRFHRKWISKALNSLYRELLGVDVDLEQRMMEDYGLIARYNIKAGAEPVPWESRKTMDIVATIACELGVKDLEGRVGDRKFLLGWWSRFYDETKRIVLS